MPVQPFGLCIVTYQYASTISICYSSIAKIVKCRVFIHDNHLSVAREEAENPVPE